MDSHKPRQKKKGLYCQDGWEKRRGKNAMCVITTSTRRFM